MDNHEVANPSVAAVILAAGLGKRMQSTLPKVLHPLAGRPLVGHVLAAVQPLGVQPLLVVGHQAAQVQAYAEQAFPGSQFALQAAQQGTGHAVMQAAPLLQGRLELAQVIVLAGDVPLISTVTLTALLETHRQSGAKLTVLTAQAPDPYGYGRIVRDVAGNVAAIVEEKEADAAQRAISEVNSGVFAYEAAWLWAHLPLLSPSPRTGEYYLTDLLAMAVAEGGAHALPLGLPGYYETQGINDRIQLAEAEGRVQETLRRRLMLAGVSMPDPASVYLHIGVEVGRDSTILPNSYLEGSTVVGEGCEIGPGSHLLNASLGDRVRVTASYVEDSRLDDEVEMGPFCHVRGNSHLSSHVRLGNFAEVNRSTIGDHSAMGHFSYLGDATLGQHVNVGAGAITANYDGKRKNRTLIGDNVFIGSDTILRAPLTVGAGASTGAGAVVTRDVPAGMIAVGVPARMLPKKAEPPSVE